MLIDMHAHTSGISRCCRADAAEVLRAAQAAGIDGLVLCNHYQELYVEEGDAAAFAEKYIAEYERTKAVADEMGVALFFGIEVTAKRHNNAHILVYGMEPDFLREVPAVYEMTLAELSEAVHARGGIVVQAHPFRGGGVLLDTGLLDGVEVNCHPLYDATHCNRLLDIAQEAGIFVTCGGDYHADTYRAVCGTCFPEGTETMGEMISHLKNAPEIVIHVQELRMEEHDDVVFVRK